MIKGDAVADSVRTKPSARFSLARSTRYEFAERVDVCGEPVVPNRFQQISRGFLIRAHQPTVDQLGQLLFVREVRLGVLRHE